MPETPHSADLSDIPAAVATARSRWSLQIVWLIPLVAALIGGWLAVKTIMERGPTITVSFKNAEGLEAGKTKLKYKDVEIGMLRAVSLSPDLKQVIATAVLVKDFDPHLVDDTRFWVVRPRIAGGTITGLGTLLSGAYIGVDAGKSSKPRHEFAGLEVPPVVSVDSPGTEFVLHSASGGSLDVGSPIFFRRLQAGQVTGYELDQAGAGVTLTIFVNAPYDRFINANTRFWNASGIDAKVDASGIKIITQSLVSILIGGIAFETPPESAQLTRAAAKTEFGLFDNRADALKNPETDGLQFVMLFHESARGLEPGAPVDFRGITVGEVSTVKLDIDPRGREILVAVETNIYPSRMRLRAVNPRAAMSAAQRKEFISALVGAGMRAQLRTSSLLTGQLYMALDFFPAAKANVNWAASPPEIPTQKGSLLELQAAIGSIAAKIDKLPLEQISGDVRQTLQSATKLITNVDSDVTPELRQTLLTASALLKRLDAETAPEIRAAMVDARKTLAAADRLLSSDAPLQTDTRYAMRELARAAQAFRVLADYLERHPEALLTGKREDGGK